MNSKRSRGNLLTAVLLAIVALLLFSLTPIRYGWLTAFLLLTVTAVLARRDAASRGIEASYGAVGLIIGYFTWLLAVVMLGYAFGGVAGAAIAFTVFIIILIIILLIRLVAG